MESNKNNIDKLFRPLKDYSLPEVKSNWDLMAYLLKSGWKKALLWKIMKVAAVSLLSLSVMATGTWMVINLSNSSGTKKDKVKEKQIVPKFNKQNKPTVTSSKQELASDSSSLSNKNYLPPFISDQNEDTVTYSFSNVKNKNTRKSNASGMLVKTKIIKSYYDENTGGKIKIELDHLSNINSPFLDFGSVIVADGTKLYFTSNRPQTEKDKRKNKGGLSQVYLSQANSSQEIWKTPVCLPEIINMPKHNNSVIGLSNDGQKMFLYRDKKGKGAIYVSTLEGLNWGSPKELPAPINSQYNEFSVALSPDGKKIFFVSDRPGGMGGKDIWVATKDENGNWANARNIRNINTSKDEAGVFIASDGKTMYFSSKGHNGYGGYDVYKSTYNGRWSKPVNLGNPINTKGDDIYFVLEADGKTGYYTSRLPGEVKNTDLYKITFTPDNGKDNSLAKLTLFKCKVVDEKTGAPLKADIVITNLNTNEVITKTSTNSATGKTLVTLPAGVDYGVTVSKPGYSFYSKNINSVKDSTYKKITQTISLTKLKKGSHVVLHNVFFDYSKATLRAKSYAELNHLIELLNKYPKMKIEIAGYTDSKGSPSFNQKLSQERAKAVLEYLIGNGMPRYRLSAKGYGSLNPIAPNIKPDGSDNPEGRQKNRRVEFVILSNE